MLSCTYFTCFKHPTSECARATLGCGALSQDTLLSIAAIAIGILSLYALIPLSPATSYTLIGVGSANLLTLIAFSIVMCKATPKPKGPPSI